MTLTLNIVNITKLYLKNEKPTLEDFLQLDLASEAADSSSRPLTLVSSILIGQGMTMIINFGRKVTICQEKTSPEMKKSILCLTNWIGLQRSYLTVETMIILSALMALDIDIKSRTSSKSKNF